MKVTLVLLGILATAHTVSAQPHYFLQPASLVSSGGNAINEDGSVTGWQQDGSIERAFITHAGNVSGPSLQSNDVAMGLDVDLFDGQEQVVGTIGSGLSAYAVAWRSEFSPPQFLPYPDSKKPAFGAAAASQQRDFRAAGWVHIDNRTKAVIWTGDTIIGFEGLYAKLPEEQIESRFYDLKQVGHADAYVGFLRTEGLHYRPIMYFWDYENNHYWFYLPEIAGWIQSSAKAVNSNGVAVGFAMFSDSSTTAVRWDSSGVTYIPKLPGHTACYAQSINNDGWVVGYCGMQWAGRRAFVFDGKYTYDLTTLVDNGQEWVIQEANGINSNDGTIVGTGTYRRDGQTHAVTLKPH